MLYTTLPGTPFNAHYIFVLMLPFFPLNFTSPISSYNIEQSNRNHIWSRMCTLFIRWLQLRQSHRMNSSTRETQANNFLDYLCNRFGHGVV